MLEKPSCLHVPPLYEEALAQLYWEEVDNADGYELDRSFDEDFISALSGFTWQNIQDYGLAWQGLEQRDRSWKDLAELPTKGPTWENLSLLDHDWQAIDQPGQSWLELQRTNEHRTIFKGEGKKVPGPDQGLTWVDIESEALSWSDMRDFDYQWEDFQLVPSIGQNWHQLERKSYSWEDFANSLLTWYALGHLTPYGLSWNTLNAKWLAWQEGEEKNLSWEDFESLPADMKTHRSHTLDIPLYKKQAIFRVRAYNEETHSDYLTTDMIGTLPRSLAKYQPPCLHVPPLYEEGTSKIVWGELYGASGYRLERRFSISEPWSTVYVGPGTELSSKDWKETSDKLGSALKSWYDTSGNDPDRKDKQPELQRHLEFADDIPLYVKSVYYRLKAYNTTDSSKYLASDEIKTLPRSLAKYKPPCIHLPEKMYEESVAEIIWGDLYGAQAFVVERSINGGGYIEIFNGNGKALEIPCDILNNIHDVKFHYSITADIPLYAKTVSFRVKAYNTTDHSQYIESAVVNTLPRSLAKYKVPCIHLSERIFETGKATITWGDLYGAEAFIIERKVNGGAYSQIFSGQGTRANPDCNVSASHYSFDADIPADTTSATFRVKAYNSTDHSQYLESKTVLGAIVKYSGNGYDGPLPNSQSFTVPGGAIVADDLLRAGYTFIGWKSLTTGSIHNPGDWIAVVTSGITTLEAQWEKLYMTIAYDGGHKFEGTAPASERVESPGTYRLAMRGSLKKTNHEFAGWLYEGVTYPEGASIDVYGTDTWVFVAQWKQLKVVIGYDPGEADEGDAPDYDYGTVGEKISLSKGSELKSNGRSFYGWEHEYTGVVYRTGNKYTVEDVDSVWFIAKFKEPTTTPTTITVTFNTNGGTGSASPSSRDVQKNFSFPLAKKGTLSRTNYTFTGWKKDNAGTLYAENATYPGSSSDLTFYAQWQSASTPTTKVTIKYRAIDKTSGTVPADQKDIITPGKVTLAQPGTLKKTGYTFIGWKSASSSSVYPAGELISVNGDGTIYFDAQWQSNSTPSTKVTITYRASDRTSGTVPASRDVITPEKNFVLAQPGTLTRTNYTFSGWKRADTGTTHSAGASIPVTGTGTWFFDAQWKASTTTSFNWYADGDVTHFHEIAPTVKLDVIFTTNTFTRALVEGYIREAVNVWNSGSDGVPSSFSPGSSGTAKIMVCAGTAGELWGKYNKIFCGDTATSVYNGLATLPSGTYVATKTIGGRERSIYKNPSSHRIYLINKQNNGTFTFTKEDNGVTKEYSVPYYARNSADHRNTICHELGHTLGFRSHSFVSSSDLMWPTGTQNGAKKDPTTRDKTQISQFRNAYANNALSLMSADSIAGDEGMTMAASSQEPAQQGGELWTKQQKMNTIRSLGSSFAYVIVGTPTELVNGALEATPQDGAEDVSMTTDYTFAVKSFVSGDADGETITVRSQIGNVFEIGKEYIFAAIRNKNSYWNSYNIIGHNCFIDNTTMMPDEKEELLSSFDSNEIISPLSISIEEHVDDFIEEMSPELLNRVDVAIVAKIKNVVTDSMMYDNVDAEIELIDTLKGTVRPEILDEKILLKGDIQIGETYLLLFVANENDNLFLASPKGSVISIHDPLYESYINALGR